MIRKIVITGGPCAGKTTGMSWIQNTFEKLGYTMLFLPEPATEMMSAGITPARCTSIKDYQIFQMKMHLEKENVFDRAAKNIEQKLRQDNPEAGEPRILIVCDRACFDSLAYMKREEFFEVLQIVGIDPEEKMRSYDAVFHLETTAKNASMFYGFQTNAVRSETPEEAAALDDRLIQAWERHPCFRVIENLNGFEDKMRHLIAEIAAVLGEKVPYEIRRRYLVDYPDLSVLEGLPDCHRVEIEQVYLRSSADEEIRIRRRTSESGEVYYLTRKNLSDGRRRLEAEGRLSEREYMRFLANADPERCTVRKTRYCLTWGNQYYEIDLYPFWTDRAMVEISLQHEEESVKIPPFLHLQREVTGDKNYEISSLARRGFTDV